jgi:hypothetical protein
MVHPSIETSFLPATALKGRDIVLAGSFADSGSAFGAAEKPFVVRLARNATDNATLVLELIAVCGACALQLVYQLSAAMLSARSLLRRLNDDGTSSSRSIEAPAAEEKGQ